MSFIDDLKSQCAIFERNGIDKKIIDQFIESVVKEYQGDRVYIRMIEHINRQRRDTHILELYYISGLSQKRIQERTGLSLSTIKRICKKTFKELSTDCLESDTIKKI